jgi:hypothetical protein
MSAKQSNPMVNVNFRVPQKLYEEVVSAAELAGEDKAEIVRRALAIGMKIMEEKGFNLRDVYLSSCSEVAQPKALREIPHKENGHSQKTA